MTTLEMGNYDEIILRMNKRAAQEVNKFHCETQEILNCIKIFHDNIRQQLKNKDKCNNIIIASANSSKIESKKRPAETSLTEDEVEVNNGRIHLHDITKTIENSDQKPRRGAAKAAQMKINKVANMKLNAKMRRPSNIENESMNAKNITIKTEKQSESMENIPAQEKPTVLEDVTNQNMPPPTLKPKRGRGRKKIKNESDADSEQENSTRVTRVTRSKVKTVVPNQTDTRDTIISNRGYSDVVIQEVPVPFISLIDSDSEIDQMQTNTKQTETDKIMDIDNESNSKSEKKKSKQAQLKKMKLKSKPSVNKEETKISTENATNVTQEISVYEDALSDKVVDNSKEIIKDIVIEQMEEEQPVSSLNKTSVITEVDDNNKNNTQQFVANDEKCIQGKVSPALQRIINKTGINLNCTVVLEPLNSTFTVIPQNNETSKKDDSNKNIITSSKENTLKKQLSPVNSILTDDDDSIEVPAPTPLKKTPAKKQAEKSTKRVVKTKPVFSPYGNSPVKKRVAAFEQLSSADIPARVTRTKTRNMANAQKEQENADVEKNSTQGSKTALKSLKYCTPLSNNKIPSMIAQTDGKQFKLNKYSSQSSSDISVKCATTSKYTHAELQERREEEQKRKLERENEVKRREEEQKRKLERENEVKLKKEATLQAKMEEQKRKREEKQLKVQKAREAKEREKEEKIRRMIQEKKEKALQEEQTKREWLAIKAAEEKRKKMEEQILKQQQEENERRKRKLNQKPPPLPTGDIEDSDQENEKSKQKYIGPPWSRSSQLSETLYTQRHIPHKFITELFQMEAQTPDLRDIFETVDERILKRNSSAVWRTPPRYSTLPKF